MIVRPERPGDEAAIRRLVTDAFVGAPHSSGTEAAIVDALRDGGALTLSLVAEDDGDCIGQVAFSPVTIDGDAGSWFGLGPVAVLPDRQGRGIGAALIEDGLARLRAAEAAGCVVLGEPTYYARFGFRSDGALILPGVPAEYFQKIEFRPDDAGGIVAYHAAFSVG